MSTSSLSVSILQVAGQQTVHGLPFPLVLACQSANATLEQVSAWVESCRESLLQQAADHGAILFRGFPTRTADDFDAFIAEFGLPNFPYNKSLSNAVRTNRTPRVFTANEAPPDVMIYLHHEMAQTPIFPSRLFFFCELPAESGGQTPICRSDLLLERLEERFPEFVRQCAEKGLRYTNVMPGENDPRSGMGRSWQNTFSAATREAVEQRLAELGYTWDWLPDACLKATTPVLPAIRQVDPGRRTFFNQLIAAFQGWKDSRNDPSRAIRLGDGSPLDREAVRFACTLADELSFDVPWQRGDVVLVDNLVTMHGRRTFSGTRKILASLVYPRGHVTDN